MARIIRRVGPCRIAPSPPGFSTIVRCIIYQQLSGKVAFRLLERLREEVGGEHALLPENVLRLTPERMRELGLSRQKIRYIRDFAAGCRNGEIDLEALHRLPDDEVLQRLISRKGVGPWTAHMYMIFALGRLDVLPIGDLGVRVAVGKAYGFDETPSPGEVEEIAAPWRPYATIATWYLWRSLGDGEGLDPV